MRIEAEDDELRARGAAAAGQRPKQKATGASITTRRATAKTVPAQATSAGETVMTEPVRKELTARGRGLKPGRQEVTGSKTCGLGHDAGCSFGRRWGIGEPAHEGDEWMVLGERADAQRSGHTWSARRAAAMTTPRPRPGRQRDGFGKEDASVQVGEGAEAA